MNKDSLPSILTLEQAADYLQLTVEEVVTAIEQGEIPASKFVGKWRILKEALDRLLPNSPASSATAKSEPAKLQPDSPSPNLVVPEEQTWPTESSISPGRFVGCISSYNVAQGFGYAQMPDGRTIYIDSAQFSQPGISLSPGNIVEFTLDDSIKHARKARAIKLVPHSSLAQTNTSNLEHSRLIPANPELSPAQEQLPASVSTNDEHTNQDSPTAQQLYLSATAARAEKRFDNARQLFRKAINMRAGRQVYEVFAAMEIEQKQFQAARQILEQGTKDFPDHPNYYVMLGQMERRRGNFAEAEKIFRQALKRFSQNGLLKEGLWQALVSIGTESSLREAGDIFVTLEKRSNIRGSVLYQRFQALTRSQRVNLANGFFQAIGSRVGFPRRRELPDHITDVVVDIDDIEMKDLYGLSGSFIVRCFSRAPEYADLRDLIKYLHSLAPHKGEIGLENREVTINLSLAFIAVPSSDDVHDQVMSILSDSNEAIIPLDDSILEPNRGASERLHNLMRMYLGARDLYSSAMPVSGRRFFGRDSLLRELSDEVHRGQFLGIYGLRKIGKTSLVYHLRDETLRGEAVAYVDLQATIQDAVASFAPVYWELERHLYARLKQHNPKIANLLRLGKTSRYSELRSDDVTHASLIFNEDMRSLLDALSEGQITGIKRLVIVLDELERILPIGDQPGVPGYLEFFALLRGLAQTERYRGLLASIVVAANALVSERGYWEDRENPVYALYRRVFPQPLSYEECGQMVRTLGKGMSVYWDDDAIALVFAETNGHPFLTRSLCSRISQGNRTRPITITSTMVQEEIPLFIRDESDKLDQILELMRRNFPEEEHLLEQIAIDQPLGNEVSDASIRHLIDYHLVEADRLGYRVTLNLLRRYLRQRMGKTAE